MVNLQWHVFCSYLFHFFKFSQYTIQKGLKRSFFKKYHIFYTAICSRFWSSVILLSWSATRPDKMMEDFFFKNPFSILLFKNITGFQKQKSPPFDTYNTWAYGCTNTGCSITSKEGRTTLVCTSTVMYYFVLFRKLHGLVGQTFHHLLGRQVKMKEEQLISAEHTVGYNSKKNANWTRASFIFTKDKIKLS